MKKHLLMILLATLVTACGGGGGGSGSSNGSSSGTGSSTDTGTGSGSVLSASNIKITTFAGSGVAGSTNGVGTAASFYSPAGLAADSAGNIYVADEYNNLIRKISPAGVVTTLAGSGSEGHADGIGTAASFYMPYAIAVDTAGNVYVADIGNNLVRKITPQGVVTTLAGSGATGSTNGIGAAASFNEITAIAVDASGNVYVATTGNINLGSMDTDVYIRKITPAGVVSTFAGNGSPNYINGIGTSASFVSPSALAIDSMGNLYVDDNLNPVIRMITPEAVVTAFSKVCFNSSGLAIDSENNLYASCNNTSADIVQVTSAGVVNNLVTSGMPSYINGTALDPSGNLYVASSTKNIIYKISPQ